MTKINERAGASDFSIPLLVSAAIVCVVVLLVAGALAAGNAKRSMVASDLVDHTQEVLNSLRAASQVNERIDANSNLYLLTNDARRLETARGNATNLDISVGHLRVLVTDNRDQDNNVGQLAACSAELTQAMKDLKPGGQQPQVSLQHCQQAINRMLDVERRLLMERSQKAHRIAISTLTTDFIFVGLALLLLVVLFGFLLRGAEARGRTDKKMLETNRNLEQSVQMLQDQADESNLLTTSRDELQLCMNLQEVYLSAKTGFSRLLPQVSGSLNMLTNSRNMMEVVCSWGEVAMEDCHPPDSCCGLRSGQPRWRQPAMSEIHCAHFGKSEPDFYVCIPVVAHGDTLGLLYLQAEDEEGLRSVRRHMDGLHQLVQLTGMAVASMKLRIKLENQSIRDALTNLFNRHFMEVALDRELSRATRQKNSVAVLMLDVDHFKEFNDTHGHAAGDTVLKAVADVFQMTVRVEDIACRYGGEEFAIILPDITAEAAHERAEGIRRAVAALRVSDGKEYYGDVTTSIGIALFPDDGTTPEVLLRKADQALYRAKQRGRNRVEMSTEAIFVA